jgi:LacI family gluconate utilization system Gnt-I transcriptional repressor
MSDVAEIAGVSAMTVSRALTDPDVVSPNTLKRIKAAIRATGYVPNRVAGSLSSRRSNVVGLIVPSLRNSLFAETIQGVADILGSKFDLMIADSGYTLKREEVAVEAFLSQRICGVVLHNTSHTPRTRRLIQEAAIPCVETGNLIAKPIDMIVGFSNHAAAFAMTEHLIERGYQRIGFVGLPIKENDRASERRLGYLAALAKHGRPADPSSILEAPPGLQSGGLALVKLVQDVPDLDAVFLTGDVLATGAVLEANRRGWAVPARIAIAGSDDDDFQACLIPPLTSLRFPRYEIGRHAAGLLVDRVLGRSSGGAVVDLGFQIMKRKSA